MAAQEPEAPPRPRPEPRALTAAEAKEWIRKKETPPRPNNLPECVPNIAYDRVKPKASRTTVFITGAKLDELLTMVDKAAEDGSLARTLGGEFWNGPGRNYILDNYTCVSRNLPSRNLPACS